MVLVDTSIWIDFFKGTNSPKSEVLENVLLTDRIIIGDLIITELLQGFRYKNELSTIKKVIDLLEYRDLVGQNMAYKAAENYNHLRRKGETVRKTIDIIIGTFCIENKITLLHNDRDFVPMQMHLGLVSI